MTRSTKIVAFAFLLAAALTSLSFLGADADDDHARAPEQTATPAQSADAKSAPDATAEKAPAANALPANVTTHHSVKLDGEVLSYTAEAGSLPLHDDKGKTIASVFYVAYLREPKDAKRPITFVFNGGPGAASAYLHLGGIGPRAIETTAKGELVGPPSRLLDNPDTWLDLTDLVFVDPVGTGYSRAADAKDEEKFWGVEQDTDSLADVVRRYLVNAGRMSSPVYLMGESYGGFRAAALTTKLQKSQGVSPSGIVLVSPALEFALLNGEDYDPLTWALLLPSLAAVNLEETGTTGRAALGAALKDTEHYALSDYLVQLASGAETGGKDASKTVAKLTGLPETLVAQKLARISASTFIKEFDRTHGQVLSRYDGSVSGPDPNPTSAWASGPDPVLDATAPLWTSAFVSYAQDELQFKTDENYRLLNREVRNKWDFGTSPTKQGYAGVMDEIQEARAMNPKLEVMIASGYTDLITPYLAPAFLVSQLPPLQGATPIKVETYAGGHMLYLRSDTRRALRKDAEAIYRRLTSSTTSPQG